MKTFVRMGVVAALWSLASSAAAYDWKVMPGSACVPARVGSNNLSYSFDTNFAGQLWFNPTSAYSFGTFTCPIVRDTVRSTAGQGIAGLGVTIIDTQSSGWASCTVDTTDYAGNIVMFQTIDSGIPFAGGYKSLSFSITQNADNGAYNITCSLNPNGSGSGIKISSYGWVEFDEI